MKLEQIRRLYEAMNDSGLAELSLKIEPHEKIKLTLEDNVSSLLDKEENMAENEEDVEVIETNDKLYEIQSDKVGLFEFDGNGFKAGNTIKKNDILGYVFGIGSKDYIKSPCSGKIVSVETPYGTIADYGKVLFVVEVEE